MLVRGNSGLISQFNIGMDNKKRIAEDIRSVRVMWQCMPWADQAEVAFSCPHSSSNLVLLHGLPHSRYKKNTTFIAATDEEDVETHHSNVD